MRFTYVHFSKTVDNHEKWFINVIDERPVSHANVTERWSTNLPPFTNQDQLTNTCLHWTQLKSSLINRRFWSVLWVKKREFYLHLPSKKHREGGLHFFGPRLEDELDTIYTTTSSLVGGPCYTINRNPRQRMTSY